MSRNYRDYFIVDGVHVGDYEGMYLNCPDPWNIEALGLRLDMEAALLLLKRHPGYIRKVLDLGCGSGFFSLELLKTLSANKAPGELSLTLADVSPTALKLAEKRFNAFLIPPGEGETGFRPERAAPGGPGGSPGTRSLKELKVEFLPLDLRLIPENNPFRGGNHDLVVMAQILWGILERLQEILSGLGGALSPDGALLVSQHFPGEKQKYGKEVVGSPGDLKAFLRDAGFTELHSLETDRDQNHHYGGLWKFS
ncbi:MAG: class I SAM-dependent methyltransferase [Deltaproteobacteria bacterium]|nr:class I SAM-dependent methyltransferase [Deltaproteobacteria bacterium]